MLWWMNQFAKQLLENFNINDDGTVFSIFASTIMMRFPR